MLTTKKTTEMLLIWTVSLCCLVASHAIAESSTPPADGGTQTNPTQWVHDSHKRMDKSLRKKAEHLLEAIVGEDRVRVSVTTVLHLEQERITTKTPLTGVEQKIEEETTKEEAAGTKSADGRIQTPGAKKSQTKTVTELRTGETAKEEMIVPGAITSVSVGIVIDLRDPSSDTGAPLLKVSTVTELIGAALGLKPGRDNIVVVDVPFFE